MKRKNLTTYIAVLCVFCAILSSNLYSAVKNGKESPDSVTVTSETSNEKPEEVLSVPVPFATPDPVYEAPKEKSVPTIKEVPVEEESRAVSSAKAFSLPSSGTETVPYSDQKLMFFPALSQWRCHLGIDFVPTDSDKVLAVSDGRVEKIFEDHLFGTSVCIDHGDGLKSFYASLSEVTVSEGTDVLSGTEIGKMGQTARIEEGIHLHFYMEKDGKTIHPFENKE